MHRRSGEVVEVLERRKVDVCCVQEVRWSGESARLLTGRDSQYRFFWTGGSSGFGGVGILVGGKWIDKVIEVKRVNHRLMMLKILVGKRTVSIVSCYAPQQGLTELEKDRFYDDLISLISVLSEDELVMLGGDLNGHVGRNTDGYEGIHGGYGYGNRNREGERILELGAALDMVVCNTFFKKRDSRLITYVSGNSKTQIDYIMVRNKDRKFLKDVKVISGEEIVQQHQLLLSDIMVDSVKKSRNHFLPKRKVWKLRENLHKSDFENRFKNRSEETESGGSVEELWEKLKVDLLGCCDEVCGWTKGPPRHKVTWWWNENVERATKEKRRLWKAWKKGGSREAYIEAKRTAKRAVYEARRLAEEERLVKS